GELPIAALRQAYRPLSQPDLMIDSACHDVSALPVWWHSQTLESRSSLRNECSHARQNNPDLCTVRQGFRQCLIIALRSSTCRVQLHWRLGQGADDGRIARVAEA